MTEVSEDVTEENKGKRCSSFNPCVDETIQMVEYTTHGKTGSMKSIF